MISSALRAALARRSSMLVWSVFSTLVLWGCQPEGSLGSISGAPAFPPPNARAAVNGALDGAPGECQFPLYVVENGDGTLAETSTNCWVVDSAFVAIRVRGTLIASVNPDAIWCVPWASAPAVGLYGPMGGGGTANWMRLLVTVRGYSPTAGLFSLTPRDTATGAPLAFGSGEDAVAYGDGYFIGKGTTVLKVLRSGNVSTVSCTGPELPYPPGCASGSARRCGPTNIYRVNGTQQLTVKPTAATLTVQSTPSPAYEGDTLTFAAASTDGRAVSLRSWLWQDSSGATTAPACSLAGTTCRFAPPGTGRMVVRARVAANPFIEQASAAVSVQPLALTVTATPTPTTDAISVHFEGLSQPATRPVADLTFVTLGAVESLGCASAACDGFVASTQTISFSALVNGRPKSATVTVEVLPECQASDAVASARTTNRVVSCVDVDASCWVGVFCLRKLTSAELTFIRDSLVPKFKSPVNMPPGDSAMCKDLIQTFKSLLNTDRIFMGMWSNPLPWPAAHSANTWQQWIHFDKKYFDNYRGQGDWGRSTMASMYLHEVAHYIANTRAPSPYGSHGPPDPTTLDYAEWPYSKLQWRLGNSCIDYPPASLREAPLFSLNRTHPALKVDPRAVRPRRLVTSFPF